MNKTPRMLDLQAEYGAPIEDVIQELREVAGGNTWRTVAGILGVTLKTLWEWRQRLGLPVGPFRGYQGYTDPLSYPHGVHTSSLEHRAIEEGFGSALDLVLHLRIDQRMSRTEAADFLGVHPETITTYTPPNMRGKVHHWRRQMLGGFPYPPKE